MQAFHLILQANNFDLRSFNVNLSGNLKVFLTNLNLNKRYELTESVDLKAEHIGNTTEYLSITNFDRRIIKVRDENFYTNERKELRQC